MAALAPVLLVFGMEDIPDGITLCGWSATPTLRQLRYAREIIRLAYVDIEVRRSDPQPFLKQDGALLRTLEYWL